MKNTFKVLGTQSKIFCVSALLMVIAFSIAACDSGFGDSGGGSGGGSKDPLLNGTWAYGNRTVTFNNGNFESSAMDYPVMKGTYFTNDGSLLTTTLTHWHGNYFYYFYTPYYKYRDLVTFKWYSRAELRALGFPEYNLAIDFASATYPYTVSGNILYLDSYAYYRSR